MNSEYLEKHYYAHPDSIVKYLGNKQGACNLYGMASFMITCAYIAHRETKDNGDAPRSRIKDLLGDWLTEDKERQLYLRHIPTLTAVTEEIADRLFRSI